MEIEFKFCIPPHRLHAVQAAVAQPGHATVHMQARYFDTADKALSSRGMAFRLRREGAQWVQTIKALGDGPLDRLEHNVPRGEASTLPGTEARPEPCPDLHRGTPAGLRLLEALSATTAPLTEIYSTDMARIVRNARLQETVAELALDTGKVVAFHGTPQERMSPLCELEIELQSGPVDGLARLAAAWAAEHGLYLSTISKAERGERLMAAQWGRPAVAVSPLPLQANAFALHGGIDAQRAAIAHSLQSILPNASEVVEAPDTAPSDSTHAHQQQLRLGLEQLQTTLQALPPSALAHDSASISAALTAAATELGMPAGTAGHSTANASRVLRNPALQTALILLMGFCTPSH